MNATLKPAPVSTIARGMIGNHYADNAQFLRDFLARQGIPITRTPFLESHRDQVGAWTVHLEAHELPLCRNMRAIEAGDFYLQRRGGGRDWELWIVLEVERVKPAYGCGVTFSDPVRYVRLKDGVASVAAAGPLKGPQGAGQPNLFRIRETLSPERVAA